MAMFDRMLQLSSQGFACAQIMMQLVLDAEEKEDPDLIRTMGALNNGLSDSGLTCGALSGGVCVLSYYAGQGQPDEMPDPNYDAMVKQLFSWFEEEMTERFGGIACPEMLGNGTRDKMSVCPAVVEETFTKALEILDEYELLD